MLALRPVPACSLLAIFAFLPVPTAPPPAPNEPPAVVRLPPPDTAGGTPVEQALSKRRSVRTYSAKSLSLSAVSQLLWAAQGSTSSDGRRTAPSAGALYPLEVHLVATRVEGLPEGIYRYSPSAHTLQLSEAGHLAPRVARAARDQDCVARASAVVLIAAVEERTARKYGSRSSRYVAFEAGAASQNLALQAVALGLGSVVVGAFDDAELTRVAHLQENERPLCLMPIGHLP